MWKLTSDDGFFPGVPNRDLSDDEMDTANEAVPGIKDCGKWTKEASSPVFATSKPKPTVTASSESTSEQTQ